MTRRNSAIDEKIASTAPRIFDFTLDTAPPFGYVMLVAKIIHCRAWMPRNSTRLTHLRRGVRLAIANIFVAMQSCDHPLFRKRSSSATRQLKNAGASGATRASPAPARCRDHREGHRQAVKILESDSCTFVMLNTQSS
jgi:hypothetical protein